MILGVESRCDMVDLDELQSRRVSEACIAGSTPVQMFQPPGDLSPGPNRKQLCPTRGGGPVIWDVGGPQARPDTIEVNEPTTQAASRLCGMLRHDPRRLCTSREGVGPEVVVERRHGSSPSVDSRPGKPEFEALVRPGKPEFEASSPLWSQWDTLWRSESAIVQVVPAEEAPPQWQPGFFHEPIVEDPLPKLPFSATHGLRDWRFGQGYGIGPGKSDALVPSVAQVAGKIVGGREGVGVFAPPLSPTAFDEPEWMGLGIEEDLFLGNGECAGERCFEETGVETPGFDASGGRPKLRAECGM